MLRGILTAAGLLAFIGPVAAQDGRLALDAASAVDLSEDRLHREGLARALASPEVVRAFLAGESVALNVVQWSGVTSQGPMLPDWVTGEGEADLVRVAGVIAASERVKT